MASVLQRAGSGTEAQRLPPHPPTPDGTTSTNGCFTLQAGRAAVALWIGSVYDPSDSGSMRVGKTAGGLPPLDVFESAYDLATAAQCATIATDSAADASELQEGIDEILGVTRSNDFYFGMDNALRHCIWMCCMVANGVGYNDAKEIGDWYETVNPRSPEDERVDQHNNYVWRQLGLCRKKSCASECIQAWQNGELASEAGIHETTR